MLILASFQSVMTYVGYVLAAILLLLIMITVHEFGHYTAGKLLGFGIEEFAIGFGPKLFRRQKKNGEYFSVRLFPLGGFCAFKGEDEDDPDPSAFNNQKPWKRIIVLAAGAFMNMLTALVIIFILFAAYGQMTLLVGDEGTGEAYSFQQYDVIIKAEDRNVYMTTDLMEVILGKKEGDIVRFLVRRGGEDVEIEVKLRQDAVFESVEDASKALEYLGVNQIYATYVRFGFFESVGRAFSYAGRIGGSIFTVLGQLLTGRLSVSALGGPITTVTTTVGAIANGGFAYWLEMAAFIGINLGVFNLLPIPALDGSRIVFAVIEWIRKKPLNRNVEAIIHVAGFVLLFGFAILVDVLKLF